MMPALYMPGGIGDVLAGYGAVVVGEIRMVGRTLYKVSLPHGRDAADLVDAASAIRRLGWAREIKIEQDVYHAHLTIFP